MSITKYLKENLLQGLRASPLKATKKSLYLLPYFVVSSLTLGFTAGIFEYKPLTSNIIAYLPFTLLVVPSIFEEIMFRGLLIPINTLQSGTKSTLFYISISTILYVVWHPFVALLNPVSAIYFLNPYFLIIVAFLGVTCGASYVYSKSLWVPILIHWVTVLFWVMLLGGRNLILD